MRTESVIVGKVNEITPNNTFYSTEEMEKALKNNPTIPLKSKMSFEPSPDIGKLYNFRIDDNNLIADVELNEEGYENQLIRMAFNAVVDLNENDVLTCKDITLSFGAVVPDTEENRFD